MYTYIVKRGSQTWTVDAQNATQAKRIICKFRGVNPSDYWCGISTYTAQRVKELEQTPGKPKEV